MFEVEVEVEVEAEVDGNGEIRSDIVIYLALYYVIFNGHYGGNK
jgi:hypothetical protein